MTKQSILIGKTFTFVLVLIIWFYIGTFLFKLIKIICYLDLYIFCDNILTSFTKPILGHTRGHTFHRPVNE